MPDALRRIVAVTAVAICLVASPAAAQEVPTGPVEIGVSSSPVRLAGDRTVTTIVDGASGSAEASRYGEVVEVRPADGALRVINDVTMRTYMEGLAEVPFSWPMEALKAQVVAARTYAWFSIQQGSFDRSGYDICATTACQVYHGRDQMEIATADRWRQAVEETEGEVLTYAGAPILARYFSTSGGRTRDNEEVFTNEGPRPYLKGVEDPDDTVSPLHRWEVTFPREHFDAILARGNTLSAVVPVADVRWVDPPTGSDRVIVTGRNGRSVEVPASSFRSFVSRTAPELYPDDYPSPWPDRDRRYPETLLSSRLSFELTDDTVVVSGRGWGHGVGMGQYGAMGKAERGLTYQEILAAYYNGLTPTRPASLPDRVRVGVGLVDGPVELRADRPVPVRLGKELITDRGMGTWRVQPRGDQLVLLAPPGFGRPLDVAATSSPRPEPYRFERIAVETVVNKPVEAALVVTSPQGEELLRRDLGVVDPGPVAAGWDLDGPDGEAVPPGDYEVALEVTDETGAVGGSPLTVSVREPAPASELASLLTGGVPDDGRTPWGRLVAAGLAGAMLGIAAGTLSARRPRRTFA